MDLSPEQYDLYVGLAATAGCAFFGVWFLYRMFTEAAPASTSLLTDRPDFTTASPMFWILRPVARIFAGIIGHVAARIEVKVGRDAHNSFLLSTRARIQRQLIAAGSPEGLIPDEFLGLMLISAIGGVGFGVFIWTKFGMPAVIVGSGILGLFMPWIWLRDRMRRRQFEIQKTLPFALDLLTLAVEAGLDFTNAVGKIVEKLSATPLGFELNTMLREIQLGKTRSEALRDLGRRVSISEMTSVTSALIQAEELGASLGPILRVQGEQLRSGRSQRAEKAAMEAPIKILAPLIAFIFPNTFIIIAGPIVLRYLIPMFSGQ